MDYIPGQDLRSLLMEARRNKRYIPEKEVLTWADQIANALTFLHGQEPPIVHRDIKPSNLKLMPHGLIKLVDFGLVKILAPEEVTITIIQGQGTALYTPLEQYGGSDAHTDIRSDIYLLTAAALKCLGGEMQARFAPRNESEAHELRRLGHADRRGKYRLDDLAAGSVMLAAAGVTPGDFRAGVRYVKGGAITNSVVKRSATGTIRLIEAHHHFDRAPTYE